MLTLLSLFSASVARAGPAPVDLQAGRSIYVAKCQACHGDEGRGDGPAAQALPKQPRDFTSAAFWASTTDEQVRMVITNGFPGTIMRGFPMPATQLDQLVAYLRSLRKS